MNNRQKQDNDLMSILKINRVDRIICDTNLGMLKLCLNKGDRAYRFTLDSTELSKEVNKELFELLYPILPKDTLSIVQKKNGKTN